MTAWTEAYFLVGLTIFFFASEWQDHWKNVGWNFTAVVLWPFVIISAVMDVIARRIRNANQ
jgi:hypothetical protein